MASDSMQKIGSWAFIIGLVIAIIMGFVGAGSTTVWILAVLGLIVGLLNVSGQESQHFLVAAIAFMLSAQGLNIVLSSIAGVLSNIIVFVAPAAAIVALRALYDVSKDR